MARLGFNVQIGVDLNKFRTDMNQAFKTLNSSTAQMKRSLAGLQTDFKAVKAVGATIAAVGIADFAKEVIQAADAFNQLQAKVKNALSDVGQFDGVFKQLVDSSNKTGSSIDSVAQAFVRLRPAAERLGVTNDQLIQFNETFSKMGALAGATSQEVSNAMIQLAQGIASNRLGGDELRSVLEQMPPIAQAIADAMKIPVEQLKDVAKDGKVTADVVLNAVLGKTKEVETKFAQLPPSVDRSTNKMKNSVQQFIGKLNEATGATTFVSKTIDGLSATVDANGEAFAVLAAQILRTTGEVLKANPMFNTLGDSIERLTGFNAAQWAINFASGLDILTINAQKSANEIARFMAVLGNASVSGFGLDAANLATRNASTQKTFDLKNKALDAQFAAREKQRIQVAMSTIGRPVAIRSSLGGLIRGTGGGGGDDKGKNKKPQKTEAEKQLDKDKSEAESIRQQNRTIFEVEKEGLDRLNKLRSEKLVSMETYKREVARLNKETLDAIKVPTEDIKKATDTLLQPFRSFLDEMDNSIQVSKPFEEVQSIIQDTLTPLEKYNQQVEHLNYLHENAGLSTEVWQRALKAAQEDLDGATKKGQDFAVAIGNITAEFGDKFFDTFVDGLKNGKFAFGDFVSSALEDLGKLIFKLTVTIPLANALTKALGGGGSNSKGGGSSTSSGIMSGEWDWLKKPTSGFLGSILTKGIGKLFGFAEGGMTPANEPFWVGEKGPELMMSPRSMRVLDNQTSTAMAGGGGGNVVNLHQYFTIQTIDNRDFEDRLSEHAKFIGNVSVQAVQRQSNRMGQRGPLESARG